MSTPNPSNTFQIHPKSPKMTWFRLISWHLLAKHGRHLKNSGAEGETTCSASGAITNSIKPTCTLRLAQKSAMPPCLCGGHVSCHRPLKCTETLLFSSEQPAFKPVAGSPAIRTSCFKLKSVFASTYNPFPSLPFAFVGGSHPYSRS